MNKQYMKGVKKEKGLLYKNKFNLAIANYLYLELLREKRRLHCSKNRDKRERERLSRIAP